MRATPPCRCRLWSAVALVAFLSLGLFAPARADEKERQKQIQDVEKQIADLSKKLSDLKAAKPKEKKALTVKDMSSWRMIMKSVLSRDGQWFAYALQKQDGTGELVLRQTKTDKEKRFGVDMVSSAAFSADGKWFVYGGVSKPAMGRMGTGPGGKVGVVDLAKMESTEHEGGTRFAFAGESSTLAMLRGPKPAATGGSTGTPAPASRGGDLVLLDLATKKELTLGNVADFSFDKKGEWLALVIDTLSQTGNGVQLRNMKTGSLEALESSKSTYQSLVWTEKGDGFTVMRATEDKAQKDKRIAILAFTDLGGKRNAVVYQPEGDAAFPKGMAIAAGRPATLSDDLSTVYFGIQPIRKAESGGLTMAALTALKSDPEKLKAAIASMAGKSDKPDLVIWHGNDDRLQSQQQVEAGRDQSFNYLCSYRASDKKFTRLAEDTLKQVGLAAKQKFAVGFDSRHNDRISSLDGKRFQDVYVIDLATGKRDLVLKDTRYFFGTSPDGNLLLYFKDKQFHVLDMTSKKSREITKGAATSFVNTEDDHNVIDPPTKVMGWAKDGSAVVISDGWDLWKVPTAEGTPVNLTGNGRKDAIRYRGVTQTDPEAKGLDFSAPMYFSMMGEWTKKTGYAKLEPGKALQVLCFEDAEIGGLTKARNSDVFVFTRQTVSEYPDVYTASADLKDRKRLTNANPEQENYLWLSGSQLVEYKSHKGEKLQGALFLPANYEKGKKYPTVVYIYEKLSDSKNRYLMPRAMGFNPALYTSNGYAVLMPDIKYELNNPGMSALWCVLPALEAAIKEGVVDRDRVGLQGHSWGGYQTAFLITKTDAFKGAVAGAPLTNLVSMYSSIYWNAGIANQPIFESSQGRFTGPYWDLMDDYMRNSPVFHAKDVKTPLMLLHNDKDGAVDWNQGIEYFNVLRRLHKPVVMLQYKGENHGLAKPANNRDYTVRMKEFFDHHLKGAPAPEWLKSGVPHLRMGDHLEERSKQ